MNRSKATKEVFIFLGKLLVGLIVISPIILGFFMSFMNANEMSAIPPNIIAKNPTTETYRKALSSVPLFKFMLNSFIVCAVVILGQIVTCSLAGYAFAMFDFKGKNILFMIVLATMMIPVDAIIIANFRTIASWGLKDTYFALVAPYMTSAMGIFLMRQNFLTIPKQLKEAASLDGCGDTRFLFSILIPISKPAIASLGVYIFIQTYNQFLWPLLVTDSQQMRTVQVGMSMLQMAEAVDYGVVLAGAMIILLPVILIFIIGHKYLIEGITAGAVKG